MPNVIVHHIKVPIINYRLLVVFALSMVYIKVFSQREGFFHIYDNLDGDYCASSVIETYDGNFILAAFDQRKESLLVKLSSEGNLLKKVFVQGENVGAFIDAICRNPEDTTQYCAIGSLHFLEDQVCKPFVLHFDDDLAITEKYVVDLPDDYKVFRMERAIMTCDGDFLFAVSLDAQNGYHRLYMKIATDGTLKSIHEATDDCASGIMVNAIFEFPEGGYYGDYRSSHKDDINQIERLFGFDDGFVFDTINEYPGIQQQSGDSTYLVAPYTRANGTALSYGNNSLLFSDRAYETCFYGIHLDSDHSSLLSLADLDGNIIKHLVIGSMNDTVDYPVVFNAIDYVRSDNDEVNNRIYHGCFGTCNGWFPCDGPNHITITQADGELNIRWQKTFTHPAKYLLATFLLATHDGGCLVTGAAYHDRYDYDLFALKINADGTLCTSEILMEDVPHYCYYPNPAKDALHLQYSPDVVPTQIELYDLQGRLVRTQRDGLETLDMEGLASGVYTMRVTVEGGKIFSDKVVKE